MARRQRRHILVSERIRQQLAEIEAMNDDVCDTSSEGNLIYNLHYNYPCNSACENKSFLLLTIYI